MKTIEKHYEELQALRKKKYKAIMQNDTATAISLSLAIQNIKKINISTKKN